MMPEVDRKIRERALKAYYDWIAKNPAAFVGTIENPDAFFSDPVCKSKSEILSLYLKINEGHIIHVKYECPNCSPHSWAVSDALCESIMGKTIGDALKVDVETVSNILGVSPEEERIKDSFKNAVKIFKTAIYNYNKLNY